MGSTEPFSLRLASCERFFRQLKVMASGTKQMLNYLRRLFTYDDWANREFLAALSSSPNPSPRSIKLLAHILSAQKLWLERLTSQPQTLPVWPDFTVPQCESLRAETAESWEGYFQQLTEAGLDKTIPYKNSKGEGWNSRVEDVLTQIITHGTHHRGQIAADLRAEGFTPPYTDFIHAVRQSLVK